MQPPGKCVVQRVESGEHDLVGAGQVVQRTHGHLGVIVRVDHPVVLPEKFSAAGPLPVVLSGTDQRAGHSVVFELPLPLGILPEHQYVGKLVQDLAVAAVAMRRAIRQRNDHVARRSKFNIGQPMGRGFAISRTVVPVPFRICARENFLRRAIGRIYRKDMNAQILRGLRSGSVTCTADVK